MTFMDGKEMNDVWEHNDENALRASSILDRNLKNQSIALVAEGVLVIIPLNNVCFVSISPAPSNLAVHIVN